LKLHEDNRIELQVLLEPPHNFFPQTFVVDTCYYVAYFHLTKHGNVRKRRWFLSYSNSLSMPHPKPWCYSIVIKMAIPKAIEITST